MSEIRKRKLHKEIGSFKLNRVSLINQSGFKFLLKKVIVNQNNLNTLKEIIINNKNIEKPFDIYFTPISNINPNIKKKENKSNPLLEKNKIIKKHNILKKIDFNCSIVKNTEHSNKNNNFTLYKNTNFSSGNKINNEISLNLPLLLNTNRENNNSSKKININLHKNINMSSSYNNFQPNICSPSIRIFNNIKKNNLFTNEIIKNTCTDIPKTLKSNYTDKEIQTNLDFDYSLNKEKDNNHKDKATKKYNYINLHIKMKHSKSNEEIDESSSNEFNDIKEIEKIISKSSLNIYQHQNKNKEKHNKYNYDKKNYINVLNNSNYEEEKDEYILLNSLYKIKNYKNHKNNNNKYFQWIEQSHTSRSNYMKTDNCMNKKLNKGKKNYYYLNNNLFNKCNISKENNNANGKEKIKELDVFIPYNDKNKIKKRKIFHLNDLLNSN